MKPWIKINLIILLVLLVVAQLVPINRTAPETPAEQDYLVATQAPEQVATLISEACYDCHSYQTEYPWYGYVAPVSLWLQYHINEAREHLNFSTWTAYTAKRAHHKMEEAEEMVANGEMPLPSFTWVHREARLTDEQRKLLVDWFRQHKESITVPEE